MDQIHRQILIFLAVGGFALTEVAQVGDLNVV